MLNDYQKKDIRTWTDHVCSNQKDAFKNEFYNHAVEFFEQMSNTPSGKVFSYSVEIEDDFKELKIVAMNVLALQLKSAGVKVNEVCTEDGGWYSAYRSIYATSTPITYSRLPGVDRIVSCSELGFKV